MTDLSNFTPDNVSKFLKIIKENLVIFFVILPLGIIGYTLYNTVKDKDVYQLQEMDFWNYYFIHHGIIIPATIIGVYYVGVLIYKLILKKIGKINNEVSYGRPLCDSINKMIEELGTKTKADRVCVIEFHNGDSNVIGENHKFNKATQNYEWVSESAEGIMLKLEGIPMSYLYMFTNDLLEKGKNDIYDVQKLEKKNSFLYKVLDDRDIDSYYSVPIFGVQNKFLGWVSLNYVQKKTKITKRDWEQLNKTSFEIGNLFSHFDKHGNYNIQ